ncbi:MAG: AAA family ATPase [Flavobacteriaceae bacterium]|nr:AAA family ATPase [Flavobacteriaceae bacterium]
MITKIFDDQYNKNIQETSKNTNILETKTAKQWLEEGKKLENPKALFGQIWHQGEVAIVFANTGKGKSALAVQIADGISKGQPILGLETAKSKVLYIDFELSTKSYQLRYTSESGELYKFNENFLRAEISKKSILFSEDESFEEKLIKSIEELSIESQAEVIIIDNITFLSASNEKSKEALELMKLILQISRKNTNPKAILLIAHTPKRDKFRPIQLEDLAGSKALSNFTDVCFCIGESVQGSDVRYIKQLKNRNYPIVFDHQNVLNCQMIKSEGFLQFEFLDFGKEIDHLVDSKDEKEERNERVRELNAKGLSNVKIAHKLNISESTVRRILKNDEK